MCAFWEIVILFGLSCYFWRRRRCHTFRSLLLALTQAAVQLNAPHWVDLALHLQGHDRFIVAKVLPVCHTHLFLHLHLHLGRAWAESQTLHACHRIAATGRLWIRRTLGSRCTSWVPQFTTSLWQTGQRLGVVTQIFLCMHSMAVTYTHTATTSRDWLKQRSILCHRWRQKQNEEA
jgi:hypothetical protein